MFEAKLLGMTELEAKSLVYLVDRPTLPFYNKGTKLSLTIIVLP